MGFIGKTLLRHYAPGQGALPNTLRKHHNQAVLVYAAHDARQRSD